MSEKRKPAIALERIRILLQLAKDMHAKHRELSKFYVESAFSLLKRFRVRLDKKTKLQFCRKCFVPWIKNKTFSVKKEKEFEIYKCMNCKFERKNFKKEKIKSRKVQ